MTETAEAEITRQLLEAAERLTRKELFGQAGDTLSMRLPGQSQMLWLRPAERDVQSTCLSHRGGEPGLHTAVYRHRADAGAVLLSKTKWSAALSMIGQVPPTLFDEQARHLGPITTRVSPGNADGLADALRAGGNVIMCGAQCLCIGMTRDRVVFNAELFEKCAMAFVIAHGSGQPLNTIPAWVRYIAVRRLRKDQQRAAAYFAKGQMPLGMNAY